MKKLILIMMIMLTAPLALANLTVGVTETFDTGLGEFSAAGGTVNAHDGYVTLGDPTGTDGNIDSTMFAILSVGTAGIHSMSLDYRFMGNDDNGDAGAADVVTVGVDIFGPGDVLAFSWTTDLNFPQETWTGTSTEMDLATGLYNVYLTHSETDAGPILSWFDVDNILIYYEGGTVGNGNGNGNNIIPAPGAIFLGSIGVSFVGWLRRRRTLQHV